MPENESIYTGIESLDTMLASGIDIGSTVLLSLAQPMNEGRRTGAQNGRGRPASGDH